MASLAAEADVAAALGRALTTEEQAQASNLLSEASDLIIGYLGADPTDTTTEPVTVPEAVTRVVGRMVARVFAQAASGPTAFGSEGTTQSMGPFSQTVRYSSGTTSGQPWIAATDKVTLRPYRVGGGMRSVALSSDQTGRYRSLS